MLQKVEALAGRQLTQKQIHENLGITHNVWYKRCTEHPELRKAFMRGQTNMVAHVAGKLLTQINEGNVSATIFFLKTKGGWTEGTEETKPENTEKQSLTINETDPTEASKIYQEIMRGTNNG